MGTSVIFVKKYTASVTPTPAATWLDAWAVNRMDAPGSLPARTLYSAASALEPEFASQIHLTHLFIRKDVGRRAT